MLNVNELSHRYRVPTVVQIRQKHCKNLPSKAELNVDRIVHCSVCNRTFSDEGYQNHLPCHGSKVLGGAGDLIGGSASIQETEGGTKRG